MQPLRNPTCPLCGQPNDCAAAATGSFDSGCWCQQLTLPPGLLDRIPEAQRGMACLCAGCVTAAAGSHPR